jgi:hypothetical protein
MVCRSLAWVLAAKMPVISKVEESTAMVTSVPRPTAPTSSSAGWAKELNLIRWNEREPKYDIREWSPDGEKMGKGVTLTKEELMALKELLNKIEL